MKNRLEHPRVKSGFTLIEMLVVIGIIALLAAIMFPVFGRVRENGRRATCSNNMRQLGLAFTQYMTDNGGRFPYAAPYQSWARPDSWVSGGTGDVPTNGKNLVTYSKPDKSFNYVDGNEAYPEKGAIYSYVREASTYVCPSDTDGNKKRLSYSMNCALSFMGSVRVKQPSEIVMLIDEGRSLNDGYFWASGDSNSTDALTLKHLDGGNLLFVDGHVKYYATDAFRIDDSTEGLANKGKMEGNPRFHDRTFGPMGSYYKPLMEPVDPDKPPTAGKQQDVCGAEF
jgi:prepilin-type N-terminal cleavage/methylation domain-containing protein/prepilin-type processing-associated H-X9-DG protein